MDFGFSPEQEALRELARSILEDHVTVERLRAAEQSDDWFDRQTWAALAEAGLLGIAVPEKFGGGGLGFLELCSLLEQVGRTVAPVPAYATLVLGALPIAEFGSETQRGLWLPGVVRGEVVLTAALSEADTDDPTAPTTTARREGNGWKLDGVKICVPAAHLATRILIPARTDGGVAVFAVEPRAAGVTLARQTTINLERQSRVELRHVAVAGGDMLGDASNGSAIVTWLLERALVGVCALQAGVTDRALAMTASYTATREQFGKPIATFQAVHQRAADAYINLEAIRWSMWQAAWRLATGKSARGEIRVAKFYASEMGPLITYAANHLHGGIGVDVDYPLHRYYLWAKQLELTLGSGMRQLAALGAQLAAE